MLLIAKKERKFSLLELETREVYASRQEVLFHCNRDPIITKKDVILILLITYFFLQYLYDFPFSFFVFVPICSISPVTQLWFLPSRCLLSHLLVKNKNKTYPQETEKIHHCCVCAVRKKCTIKKIVLYFVILNSFLLQIIGEYQGISSVTH